MEFVTAWLGFVPDAKRELLLRGRMRPEHCGTSRIEGRVVVSLKPMLCDPQAVHKRKRVKREKRNLRVPATFVAVRQQE